MRFSMKAKFIGAVAAGALTLSSFSFAQEKASGLDELLQMVKQSKIAQTQENKQREAQFKRNKSEQAKLLAKAENTKKLEEARSAKLEAKYKTQEQQVREKQKQLDERLGSLNELFGHLTSSAGDLRSNLKTSIVSAQKPGRGEPLVEVIEKMNSGTRLPSIEEIELIWSGLLDEMIESGKIVTFQGEVSDISGNTTTRTIVRVGNYNLFSDGKYLSFDPKSGVTELPKQPSGSLLSAAEDIQVSSSGFTKVGIDPTGPMGGNLLRALINSPTLTERWHQGGETGYVITAVFVVALIISIFKGVMLFGIGGKVRKQLSSTKASVNNPLGRVLKVAEDNPGCDSESLELKLEEAILKERPGIESWLGAIKIISMVAPLLGLLGTVTGMIVTFQAITIYGAGDPKAMAGGISGALVTTVLGLIVAIPTVLIHSYLNSRAKSIVQVLEEQSAGLIAEKAES